MTGALSVIRSFLIVAFCFGLTSCSIIQPALTIDMKDRICNRSGDIKEVAAAEAIHRVNQGIIEGSNWTFEDSGKIFLEMQVRISVPGDYEIALDFHEPFEDLQMRSSLGGVCRRDERRPSASAPCPMNLPGPVLPKFPCCL